MEEYNQQTAELLKRSSDFIRSAESFSRYSYKEWIEGNTDERAMLMCCIDRTTMDGTGCMTAVTGDGDMIAAALAKLMSDKDLDPIFRRARIFSETYTDMSDSIRQLRGRLRTLYCMAAFDALWTLCIIGFQIFGDGRWITTVSNLLLMAFVFLLVGRDIMERRRMLKHLQEEDETCKRERAEYQAQAFIAALKERLEQDGDDDE